MIRLEPSQPGYESGLARLKRRLLPDAEVAETVSGILTDIRRRGDDALFDYTEKFGGPRLTAERLRVEEGEVRSAWAATSRKDKAAMRAAHRNVRDFARNSLRKGWRARNRQGAVTGERFDPLQRVGIYVPGGTAPLVSTALMTCTLAEAAGVPEIVVCTPCDKAGEVARPLLAALHLAGATEIYRVGGAQAIGAMAYGTASIRAVDKVFGPGNAYVVEAKRQVFGVVAVDLLPGPSEVVVLADATANPAWVAADLLAQAEHGHGSTVGLVTTSKRLLQQVADEVDSQAATLSRGSFLREVIEKNTFLVLARSLNDAIRIVNDFAPEHASLAVADAKKIAARLTTCGALFIGHHAPVAAGDFMAGPSHELPTGGAGRAFPGLTTDMFQRRTSFVEMSARAVAASAPIVATLAALEGLDAHARSATIRIKPADRGARLKAGNPSKRTA